MIIKYTYEKTIVGWNWHPVIDDQVLFYPHGSLSGVRQFVNEHISAIKEYVNSDDNYGLGFYVCDYDGKAQNRFRDNWAELGVSVF